MRKISTGILIYEGKLNYIIKTVRQKSALQLLG